MAKNTCQYWSTIESQACSHWDAEKTICTYKALVNGRPIKAQLAPYCNLLGTASATCKNYDGDASVYVPRCALPDPQRHVANKTTCDKWVHTVVSGATSSGVADNAQKYGDYPLYEYNSALTPTATNKYWTFEDINGYNAGQCDGAGTTITCSGYSPYHMSFGRLQPKRTGEEDYNDIENLVNCYTEKELGYRTPLPYIIYNIRAQLSKCYWWQGSPTSFAVDPVTGFEIPFENKCKATDDNVQKYWDYYFDDDYGYVPPCNGAKQECPHYTGVCWRFCVDDKMREGSKILAEQILELRYYMRRERWADLVRDVLGSTELVPIYDNYFLEPDIYAWRGTYTISLTTAKNAVSSLIHAVRNYFEHFDYFDVSYDNTTLTHGVATATQKNNYPTLIRELSSPSLKPIIRNVFNKDDNGANIYETGDLSHEYLVFWGESFIYNSERYAINLADPELESRMPMSLELLLRQHDSVFDITSSLSDEKVTEFNSDLDTVLDNLVSIMPDRIYSNELPASENGFYIRTKTFFGENTVLVFEKQTSGWEFDKISFTKKFCGGIIAQTSFTLNGDGKTVYGLPKYEETFLCGVNNNGRIGLEFLSLDPLKRYGEIAYTYNATVQDTYSKYKLYKIKVFDNDYIDEEHVKFFGNKGKLVVTLPNDDGLLNYVHAPFVKEGNFILTVTDVDGNTKDIVMSVQEWCTDALEVNQVVLYPKNMQDFVRPCSFVLKIPKLYVYEKRSFGELPSAENYEDVTTGNYSPDGIETEVNEGKIYLTKFSDDPVMFSVVYKDSFGNIKGITRTKPIMWVRQPYCRDVEIKYNWTANYIEKALYPTGVCYGPRYEVVIGTAKGASSPPCGDHDKSLFSPSAAVWYPYDECANTASYSYYSSAHPSITTEIEQFDDRVTDVEHGNFDMRMLGPVDNYGFEESDAHLWACTCDFKYFNGEKISENMFSGYSYYRGGMDDVAMEYCTRDGGTPPKFGNVVRDQLNTFRTMDCVTYYKLVGATPSAARKWMPIPQHYTLSSITSPAAEYYIDLFTDDYDSPFVHQMGLLGVDTIEDIEINETVDNVTRFRFEDVFEAHATTTALYPMPRPYQVMGEDMTPVMAWYIFKDYPLNTSRSIQWAWQEKWIDIDRTLSLHSDILLPELINPEWSSPYKQGSGVHKFLSISHPNYILSYKQEEKRIVCEEGEHIISIIPSVRTSNESTADQYFLISLDDGPPKVFDMTGSFVTSVPTTGLEFSGYDLTDINLSLATYMLCDGSTWTGSANLYEAGTFLSDTLSELENQAVSDDRWYYMFDSYGDRSTMYFNRGLNVSVNSSALNLLPHTTVILSPGTYEWAFDRPALNPPYDSSEAGSYYPSVQAPNLMYDISMTDMTLDIKFNLDDFIFISKVNIVYNFGAEIVGDLVETGEEDDILYHIPELHISKITDAGTTEIYTAAATLATTDSTAAELITVSYEIQYDIQDLPNSFHNLLLHFVVPSSEDITAQGIDAYYAEVLHRLNIFSITLYTTKFTSASEKLYTYERKYYVSHGGYPDLPIQGTSYTGQVLFPPYDEISTPSQLDNLYGILGAPNSAGEYKVMSKTAGRLLKSCVADKTRVPGADVRDFELEQKRIFDENIGQGNTSFTMHSICPPGLDSLLSNLGLRFPYWTCIFTNTMNLKLANVLPQAPFNPCGYKWSSTRDTPREGTLCYPNRSTVDDLFTYTYYNPCSGDAVSTNDWVESMFQAATNRLELTGSYSLFSIFTGDMNVVIIYTGGTTTIDTGSLTTLSIPY